jgi:hypothetical protein
MRTVTDADVTDAIMAELNGEPLPAEAVEEVMLLAGFNADSFDRILSGLRIAALEKRKQQLRAQLFEMDYLAKLPEDWL